MNKPISYFFLFCVTLPTLLFLFSACEKNNCVEPKTPPNQDNPPNPLKKSITKIDTVFSGIAENLYDATFTDLSTGFICGNNGTILKTTDGGETWVQKNSGTTEYLRRIIFIDNNVGFAVGNYATILKTFDGGETWVQKHYDGNVLQPKHLRILKVINSTTLYVGGAWGAFYTSTDIGETWTDHNIDNSTTSYDMFFQDPQNGIICGNFARMFKTTNAGISWTPLYNTVLDSRMTIPTNGLVDMHFINNQTGFACLVDGANFNLNKLIKTTDFGETWSEVKMPTLPSTSLFYDIDFSDSKNGLIVTNGGTNNKGQVLKTTDGGNSWSILYSLDNNLSRAFLINDTTAIMVGDNGKILKGY